jgi:hypothetical protein
MEHAWHDADHPRPADTVVRVGLAAVVFPISAPIRRKVSGPLR